MSGGKSADPVRARKAGWVRYTDPNAQSLTSAKDSTNKRTQQQHFNKHILIHTLSHSAKKLVFFCSLDPPLALMHKFPLQYVQRDADEKMKQPEEPYVGYSIWRARQCMSSWAAFFLFLCFLFNHTLVHNLLVYLLFEHFFYHLSPPAFPLLFDFSTVLSFSCSPALFIEAHSWTLVHAHISITEKSAGIALDVLGV